METSVHSHWRSAICPNVISEILKFCFENYCELIDWFLADTGVQLLLTQMMRVWLRLSLSCRKMVIAFRVIFTHILIPSLIVRYLQIYACCKLLTSGSQRTRVCVCVLGGREGGGWRSGHMCITVEMADVAFPPGCAERVFDGFPRDFVGICMRTRTTLAGLAARTARCCALNVCSHITALTTDRLLGR